MRIERVVIGAAAAAIGLPLVLVLIAVASYYVIFYVPARAFATLAR